MTQAVKRRIRSMPKGKIFVYLDLPNYTQSPSAVSKIVSRMVAEKKLERLSKGKFYLPQKGLLGMKKPSEQEVLRSLLYKKNRLFAYITGPSLYHQLGLTTQIPQTITIACNGGRQKKVCLTMRVNFISTRIPIEENKIKLMQYLDALKDIKKIPDSDINVSLKKLRRYISLLSSSEQKCLVQLATTYYTAQVRALTCMLLSSLDRLVPSDLAQSLNPMTTYSLGLNQAVWPMAKKWNIQ